MTVRLIQVCAHDIVFTLKIRIFILNCYKLLIISIFMLLFFLSIRSFFYYCFVFPYIIMCISNISRPIKRIPVNEIKGFISEKYFKRIGFSKENN